MCKDTMEYIQGCAECQRHKINTCPMKAPLQPIFPRSKAMPFETVTLDFITKLLKLQDITPYSPLQTTTVAKCQSSSLASVRMRAIDGP